MSVMRKLSFTIPKCLQGNHGLNGAVPQWLPVTSLGVRPEAQSLGIWNFWSPMTDYYRVIARGIADLDTSSPDSRREFYWRARAELELQLCGLDPPLKQSEMIRERLALDEAIRKIEAEAECLPRVDAPDTAPTRPVGPPSRKSRPLAARSPRLMDPHQNRILYRRKNERTGAPTHLTRQLSPNSQSWIGSDPTLPSSRWWRISGDLFRTWKPARTRPK